MNTTPSAYLTGFCCEHHTLSISSGVITDANPSRSSVLWHLFLFSKTAPASVPSRTCKSRRKTRDGRTGRPARLSASSLVYLHLPPPSPCLPITALPFVFPSVIFIAPSLSPSLPLNARWGHCTPPLPDTRASASFCHRSSPESLVLTGVLCELGQRSSSFLYRCLAHAKEIGSNNM